MINPAQLFQLKRVKDTFVNEHPKVAQFAAYVASTGVEEGTVLSVSLKRPDGKTISTNMQVTASDLEALQILKGLAGNK